MIPSFLICYVFLLSCFPQTLPSHSFQLFLWNASHLNTASLITHCAWLHFFLLHCFTFSYEHYLFPVFAQLLFLSQTGTAWFMHSITPLYILAHLLYSPLNFDLLNTTLNIPGHLFLYWISLSHCPTWVGTPSKPLNLWCPSWHSNSFGKPLEWIFDSIKSMLVLPQAKHNSHGLDHEI